VSSRQPGGGGEDGSHDSRIVLPSVTLPGGALGAALVVAIATLPFLLGLGLLLLGRVWGETRRLSSGRLRMALAAELDLKPRELANLNTEKLLKLRDQIAFDEVTGVLRRVAGIAALDREIARARRARVGLVAAFIDLDNLKRVNDSRGHAAGDAHLRGVAQLLQRGLRRDDLVFRYGGDEFVCALPGSTLEDGDSKLRELRAKAVKNSMPFSFGVAELLDAQRSRREQELTGAPLILPLGAEAGAPSRSSPRPRRAL
jgi:diguanylate cyclase (GGDEF)-like protein